MVQKKGQQAEGQMEGKLAEGIHAEVGEKLVSRRKLLASIGMAGITLAAGGLLNADIAEAKGKPPKPPKSSGCSCTSTVCKTYTTINDAFADTTLQPGDVIRTIWYEQADDYGGWTYVVTTGGIVKGKFEPVAVGPIPVNVFGIYGNRTDNSTMLNVVIKRYEYKVLQFLGGKYTFTQPILFNQGYEIAKLEGIGQYNTEVEYTGTGFLFDFEAGLNEYNTQNIVISKMTLTGNGTNDFANLRGMSGGSIVEQCIFRNFRDVIKIGVSWYAKVIDCLFYGNHRYSLYFSKPGSEQINNFTISGCYFMGSQHHIYSEGQEYFGQGINIENCTFEASASTGIVLTCFTNIKISGCYFENNATGVTAASIGVPLHIRLNGYWFEASNARISDTFFECVKRGKTGIVCAISTNDDTSVDWDQVKTMVENCFFGQFTDAIDYNVYTTGELIYRGNTNYYHMPAHEHNKAFKEIVLARQAVDLASFTAVEMNQIAYNQKQNASALKIRFTALENNITFTGASYQWEEWDGSNAVTESLPGQPLVKGQLLAEHTAAPLDNYLAGKLKGGSTGLGTLGSCHALVEIVAITRDII